MHPRNDMNSLYLLHKKTIKTNNSFQIKFRPKYQWSKTPKFVVKKIIRPITHRPNKFKQIFRSKYCQKKIGQKMFSEMNYWRCIRGAKRSEKT